MVPRTIGHLDEGIGKACLLGEIERFPDAHVIGVKAKDAGDKGSVGSMPSVGPCKGVIEREGYELDRQWCNGARHSGDAQRTSRVRA